MGTEVYLEIDDGIAVDVDALRGAAEAAAAGGDGELAIRISGDEFLQVLNREHRGIDEPTDVLSFGMISGDGDEFFDDHDEDEGYLGDVAISVDAARRNAALTGTPLERELRHLVTHGVLHLLGFDHEAAEDAALMRAREVELLGDWVHVIWDAPPTH